MNPWLTCKSNCKNWIKFSRVVAVSGCDNLPMSLSSGCAGGLVAPKLITDATNPPAIPDDKEVGRPSHPDAAVYPIKCHWVLSPRKIQDWYPRTDTDTKKCKAALDFFTPCVKHLWLKITNCKYFKNTANLNCKNSKCRRYIPFFNLVQASISCIITNTALNYQRLTPVILYYFNTICKFMGSHIM
jgi:hypothetical protein